MWISGIPDFIGCYRGQFFAIECKTKTDTSPIQKATIPLIRAAGGIVIIAKDTLDVVALIYTLTDNKESGVVDRFEPYGGYEK